MSIRIGTAVVLPLLLAASSVACTHETRVPRALTAARAECARAENGPARRLQPVAVDDAQAALADAEAAYKDGNENADLRAVYAQRKAQLAESMAATEMARQQTHDAIAERNVLIETREAEAKVIAERNAPQTPAGAAEMQAQPAKKTPATKKRAPGSTPQAAPQSDAPPQAR
ncbi:MAG TPA: DUF4398 domain-containing protein [Polyangiaceae bacterium]